MLQANSQIFKDYQVQVLKNSHAMAEALVKKDYSLVSGSFCYVLKVLWLML